MTGRTFAEKIFDSRAGSIVFRKPDLVLSHDNTSSIIKTFRKMQGERVLDPNQLLFVLDHNAPPTTAKLANDYQAIRDFARDQGVARFHDVGDGICHQVMARYARPGMLIVGSDSHTCTAGAFAAFSAGIDRTETAGLWTRGETWFRVPETIKINLTGRLEPPVAAKDVALWLLGRLGASGATYKALEFHGEGVATLCVADRMTLANLASEMGAKSAAFPPDKVLAQHLGTLPHDLPWADPDATYAQELTVALDEVVPVVAAPHNVDNVKTVAEVAGTPLHHALLGTCTNGRIEDLREAARILEGRRIPAGFQMMVTPASKEIYRQAMDEGLLATFMDAGASILAPSCGPCLGTGQGIPADHANVISTANRNFLGRMGNKAASIYLASPATVAASVLAGRITDPRPHPSGHAIFPFSRPQSSTVEVAPGDDRRRGNVWDYTDVDNFNTDQMFAGNLTYSINSSEPERIAEHLFKGFDDSFAERVQPEDICLVGENFGCGSSREHPAVGLAHAGVRAVVAKSVARIFFRASVNQGLPIIVHPEAVAAYRPGDPVTVDFEAGTLDVGEATFDFAPLPDKLLQILQAKGLVNWLRDQ